MAQMLNIHPVQPQLRLIRQVVATLNDGGAIVYPTDSAYALGCKIGEKDAAERIRHFRHLDKAHNFTLVCHNLSELATYARVDNAIFRLLKSHTPGPYTFILTASKEVPRRLQHPKRKTIGLRIPDNAIVQSLLEELHEPLMSVTLILPDSEIAVSDPEEVYEQIHKHVDLIVNGGSCGIEPTTVIDCVSGTPQLIRAGKGKFLL